MNSVKNIKVNLAGRSDFWFDKEREQLLMVGPDKNLKSFCLKTYDWLLVVDMDAEFFQINPYSDSFSDLIIVSENSVEIVKRDTLEGRRTIYQCEDAISKIAVSLGFIVILKASGQLLLLDKSEIKVQEINLESAVKVIDIKSEGFSNNDFFFVNDKGILHKLEVELVESKIHLVEGVMFRGEKPHSVDIPRSFVDMDDECIYFFDYSSFFVKIPKNDIGSPLIVESIKKYPLSEITYFSVLRKNHVLIKTKEELLIFDIEFESTNGKIEMDESINNSVVWNNNLLVLDSEGILSELILPEADKIGEQPKRNKIFIDNHDDEEENEIPQQKANNDGHDSMLNGSIITEVKPKLNRISSDEVDKFLLEDMSLLEK